MSLAAGTRLGPYEVLGLIAAGGMGEVYKARDTRLDRAVASLNHPHILIGLVRQDVRVVAVLIRVITFCSSSLSDTGLFCRGYSGA